jgi:hypothetical protein
VNHRHSSPLPGKTHGFRRQICRPEMHGQLSTTSVMLARHHIPAEYRYRILYVAKRMGISAVQACWSMAGLGQWTLEDLQPLPPSAILYLKRYASSRDMTRFTTATTFEVHAEPLSTSRRASHQEDQPLVNTPGQKNIATGIGFMVRFGPSA